MKDIDHKVEGAVVVVAAKFAVNTVKELMENGAKWITIITGGFKESKTPEGIAAQVCPRQRFLRFRRRLCVWPTSITAVSSDRTAWECTIHRASIRCFCRPSGTFLSCLSHSSLAKPNFGPVGVFSQSGALGVTLLNELAGRTNEGWISKFISFGNACDVDELDALKYYTTEPTIQQIWSYLEGFHNGPAFINAVKEATQKKPVLLIKANRGAAGAKASASHSASLAANDAVCDQLLKNVGNRCFFCHRSRA